jgi:hypothetical protein
MSNSLSQQKFQLRHHCRVPRESLGEEMRVRASLSICERIESWRVFQQSKVIFTILDLSPAARPIHRAIISQTDYFEGIQS